MKEDLYQQYSSSKTAPSEDAADGVHGNGIASDMYSDDSISFGSEDLLDDDDSLNQEQFPASNNDNNKNGNNGIIDLAILTQDPFIDDDDTSGVYGKSWIFRRITLFFADRKFITFAFVHLAITLVIFSKCW